MSRRPSEITLGVSQLHLNDKPQEVNLKKKLVNTMKLKIDDIASGRGSILKNEISIDGQDYQAYVINAETGMTKFQDDVLSQIA